MSTTDEGLPSRDEIEGSIAEQKAGRERIQRIEALMDKITDTLIDFARAAVGAIGNATAGPAGEKLISKLLDQAIKRIQKERESNG